MNTPTYKDEDGNKWTTPQINKKSDQAAKNLLLGQFHEYGYNFCQNCKRNDCKPIDVSHNVSRKQAKETGKTQLCWDPNNMEILGRKCHQIKDKLI